MTSMADHTIILDMEVGFVIAMTARIVVAIMAKVPSAKRNVRANFLERLIRRW